MRPTVNLLAAIFVTAGLLAGCSGSDDSPKAVARSTTTTTAATPLPTDVSTFVDGVAAPGAVAFRATYHVLRKLGGEETDVEVLADPPSWELRTGDFVFVDGPKPATCRTSKRRCVGEVHEELLTGVGVFSRFFSTAPAQALATDARRDTAGNVILSERSVAGVTLRCAAVPIGGTVASTFCLTPEGVFGAVDTPAVRYELTAYAPGPPGEPVEVPYAITNDASFLRQP